MTDPHFRWAAGVECSFIPHLGIDQYRWTQHDKLWRTDLELIANDLGCRWLRYALPWHEIEREPGQYDWSWFDVRLAHAESLGITFLLDLVHFGTPTWLPDSFADPDFPQAVERFARVFGERYSGRVHHVCPVNEPLITALFCGDVGLWPPYGLGLRSYMTVLTRVAEGLCRAIKVLRATMPGMEILVSDSLEVAVTYEDSDEKSSPFLRESLRADVARRMERRHIVMDLVMGHVTKRHPLSEWLDRNGFSSYDLRWFERNAQKVDIIGLDYYEHTEVELYTTPEGYYRQRSLQPPMGLYRAAQDYWNRYQIPLMVTETSAGGADADKIHWLERSTNDVRRLRAEGFPVVGYTWWPVIDHLDWDGALLHQTGHIHPVGIYGLERQAGGRLARNPTGLRDAYRALIQGGDETAGPLVETEKQREVRQVAAVAGGKGTRVLRYPIIVHGRSYWERGFVWRRGQHLTTRLSKDHPVLYVDPIRWTDGEDDHPRVGMTYFPDFPNISNLVIHLPVSYRGEAEATRLECRRLLAEALAQPPLKGCFDEPVHWFDDPDAAAIFQGQVNARAVVYDCADREPDAELLASADVVFAGSGEIQDGDRGQGAAGFTARAQRRGRAPFPPGNGRRPPDRGAARRAFRASSGADVLRDDRPADGFLAGTRPGGSRRGVERGVGGTHSGRQPGAFAAQAEHLLAGQTSVRRDAGLHVRGANLHRAVCGERSDPVFASGEDRGVSYEWSPGGVNRLAGGGAGFCRCGEGGGNARRVHRALPRDYPWSGRGDDPTRNATDGAPRLGQARCDDGWCRRESAGGVKAPRRVPRRPIKGRDGSPSRSHYQIGQLAW